jgi:hypothetical protein
MSDEQFDDLIVKWGNQWLMSMWNALVIFVALSYLLGGLLKPAMVATFALVSGSIGYGQRRLTQGGFGLAVVVLSIWIGALPPPSEWAANFEYAQQAIARQFNLNAYAR